MSLNIEDYGSAEELHLVIEGLSHDVEIDITEDDGRYWFTLRDAEGRHLDEAWVDPRRTRDNTYEMHKRPHLKAPPPVRDDLERSLTIEPSDDRASEVTKTVGVGQYLNRVAALSPDNLRRGDPPDAFPSVADADSFAGMYVVALPARDVSVADELDADSDVAVEPLTEVDETASVRLFDLRLESEFEVSVTTFRAHYGRTIWNTGRFWDIE